MASFSEPRRKPCSPSPLIPSTWAPRSAFSPCFTLGALDLLHHPHLHCVVPGGGLSLRRHPVDFLPGWIFLTRGRALRLFRRLFLEYLLKAFDAGKLGFFSSLESLRDRCSFLDYLAPLREAEWVVYAKKPFAGPEQVFDYVGRYTHRVAISNNRLLDIEEDKVTFRYKDYRHDAQQKTMTVEAEEFIRRFLLHVLPEGFQRIRYYGFLANRYREEKLTRCRELLEMPAPEPPAFEGAKDYRERYQELLGPSFGECPACHQGRMLVIEILPRSHIGNRRLPIPHDEKHCFGMQNELRWASLAGTSDRSSAATRPIANLIQATNVVRRRSDKPFDRPRTIPTIPYIDRLRPLQILARDPAGNQYT